MVNVVEGVELKPCRSHGEDPGPLERMPGSESNKKRAISITHDFLPELGFLALVENLELFFFFFFPLNPFRHLAFWSSPRGCHPPTGGRRLRQRRGWREAWFQSPVTQLSASV